MQGSPRVIAGVAWALTSSRSYPPHLLLEALAKPGVSKSAVLEVINAQRTRFSVRELLTAAYAQEPNEKAALFRIIGETVDDAGVPELLGRLQGKDSMARLLILGILGRFNRPDVRTALQAQLGDGNKLIRSAALGALAKMDGPIEVERICALLLDPEIEVQNRAVEVLIKAKRSADHPLPGAGAQGRERIRAARRGRGAERDRQCRLGEVPAGRHQGFGLVGALARRRRARQDRRPQGDRRGAGAGARQG